MKKKSDSIVQKVKDAISGKSKSTTPAAKGKTGKAINEQQFNFTDYTAELQITDDIDEDFRAEADALKKTLREADKKYAEHRKTVSGSEFWCCLIFETQEQKNAFIAAMGWALFGDKYLNGLLVARKQGIDLGDTPDLSDNPTLRSRWQTLVDDHID